MPQPRVALVFGITGQDGAYLAQLLLQRGCVVHGTSRDGENSTLQNLIRLGVAEQVTVHSVSLVDARSVYKVVQESEPDLIFNLAGQTSVGLSFDQPAETFESIVLGTVNILEAVRLLRPQARVYNAGSSEVFGDTDGEPACETTAFRPCSPYAIAKAAAFWTTANYREAYGLFACSGILFNHESPLRSPRFVTQKIVRAVVDIAEGKGKELMLGNIDVTRDWGWAPDYVDAIHRILELDRPDDFVIATGVPSTLREFVDTAFAYFGLDTESYIRCDSDLYRPADNKFSVGDPSKAAAKLGWRATVRMPDLVRYLIEAELARRAGVPSFATVARDTR